MDIEELKKQREQVEAKFTQLDKRRNEDLQEMHRLQGEHRLLGELVNELEKAAQPEKQDGGTEVNS